MIFGPYIDVPLYFDVNDMEPLRKQILDSVDMRGI